VARRTVPDGLLRWRVSLGLPEGLRRPLGGTTTLPDRHGTVNAPNGTRAAGSRPGAGSQSIVPGAPPALADGIRWPGSGPWGPHGDPPRGGAASPGDRCLRAEDLHTIGDMRGATRPSACHLVLEAQRAFRSRPSPLRLWERAPPADLSDLPHPCELWCHHLGPPLLHRDDKDVTQRLPPP